MPAGGHFKGRFNWDLIETHDLMFIANLNAEQLEKTRGSRLWSTDCCHDSTFTSTMVTKTPQCCLVVWQQVNVAKTVASCVWVWTITCGAGMCASIFMQDLDGRPSHGTVSQSSCQGEWMMMNCVNWPMMKVFAGASTRNRPSRSMCLRFR